MDGGNAEAWVQDRRSICWCGSFTQAFDTREDQIHLRTVSGQRRFHRYGDPLHRMRR